MAGRHRALIPTLLAICLPAGVATAAPPKAPTSPAAKGRSYICPIDGGRTSAVGHDGRPSPKRYTDFEMPTRAYTNLVVACPKCGYANWTHDFERPVTGGITTYVMTHFKKSPRRAAAEPAIAYQHHMNLLHNARADIREQIGTALFFTYVLKRKRPWGGMNPALERRIVAARKRALKLMKKAMREDPPRTPRGRMEWRYLLGEISRLTGDPKAATPILKDVCEQREAGITVRNLACEMVERARRGDTSEDYRDGKFDMRGIEAAEKRAKVMKAAAERNHKADKRAAKAAEQARSKAKNKGKAKAGHKKAGPLPPPNVPLPPPYSGDKYAPPPPPPAG